MGSAIIAGFLVVHGLIHASFLGPRPPATTGGPQWPFDLTTSWVLSPLGLGESTLRLVAIVLLAMVLLGFVAAALATLGIAPAGAFVPALAGASVASIAMLALFFHPWLVLGLAIDAVLLWAALANGWRPGTIGVA